MTERDWSLVGEERGPCGLCGFHDARHRVYEAIEDRLHAGESAESCADDYDLPLADVLAIAAADPREPQGA